MKEKPKIKAVIFDLGGVIMSGGYLPFIHNYCLECLTKAGKKKISDLEHQVNLGTITEKKFYREIQKVFHVHLTPKQMHTLIVGKMQVNKSLLGLMPKLKPAQVALFTNSIGQMAIQVLRQRGVPTKKVFNKVFLSNTIHMAKPDSKAYSYVIKKLRIKPAEALMVDDRKDNITAAKKQGLRGLLFTTTKNFEKQIKQFELV